MIDFREPKMNDRYIGMATKNLYQPVYDVIHAQSMWTDAASRWYTDFNKKMIQNIDEMVNKS